MLQSPHHLNPVSSFIIERIGELRTIGRVIIPIPFPLKTMNAWVLPDGTAWDLVDCGCSNPETIAAWEQFIGASQSGRGPRILYATHGHVDHIGCSALFVERFGARFSLTDKEYQDACETTGEAADSSSRRQDFMQRHGVPVEQAAILDSEYRASMRYVGPQPKTYDPVHDEDVIRLGSLTWRVMVAGGHAPAHAALYSEDANVLIAGDHILPRISPVIGVFSNDPRANPLGAYLESFDRFLALPRDTLVLPSHGEPFVGLHERITALREHHAARLKSLIQSFHGAPRSAFQLAESLFPRAIAGPQAGLALAETLAHIHYLVATGAVAERNKARLITFERA
ncbi:MAG: MBL fold metallo-hydrolase [Variibacter sp.]